jgi:Protein of unknown function (DUF3224)
MEKIAVTYEARGTFQVKEWSENPVGDESSAPKMMRASATAEFRSDIEGTGATENVMMYRGDNSAVFTGLTRIAGRLGEREGTFVMQGAGTFDPASHTAKCKWTVVPGSGTGELQGLTGKGSFEAPGIVAEYLLEYEVFGD